MAQASLAERLPSLYGLELSGKKVRCIYPLPKEERQCSRDMELDAGTAKTLREELVIAFCAEGSPAPDVHSSLIEKLADHFCCWQHKIKLHADTHLGNELRRRWKDQLKVGAPEHPVVEDNVDASSSVLNQELDTRRVDSSAIPRSVPRYNLRSTRHNTRSESTLTADISCIPGSEFQPMKEKGLAVGQKLLKGPTRRQLGDVRDLYAFGRDSSPGFVKIGVSKNVEARLNKWSRDCLYQPLLKHHIREVPYAQFVEGLTHAELHQSWRRETKCKHNKRCLTQHQEWFQVDDVIAFRVMDSWVRWIRLTGPYDELGRLRPEWRLIIEDMVKQGVRVTSQALLDALESLQELTESPPNDSTAQVDVTANDTTTTETEPLISTPAEEPVTPDLASVANMISTAAEIILSLTLSQRKQLQDILDRTAVGNGPAPRAVPIPPVLAA